MRFAQFGGEYNITSRVSEKYNCPEGTISLRRRRMLHEFFTVSGANDVTCAIITNNIKIRVTAKPDADRFFDVILKTGSECDILYLE